VLDDDDGHIVHISEMFRLVRGTGHILDVLDVLHREQVALRIHDGAFSAMDLTARHPRTGELLSTVKFMLQTLAAAGELQRDLQRELTYDGLRAAATRSPRTIPLHHDRPEDHPTQSVNVTALPALPTLHPGIGPAHILPGCGHWIAEEYPDQVNATLLEFLGSLNI
jgi:pimeloyl-ACP methyl ester carboxylesterase